MHEGNYNRLTGWYVIISDTMVYLLVLLVVFLGACSKKEQPSASPQQRQISVSLYEVKREEIENVYSVKAYFESTRDVLLKPEVSGRVLSVNVEEGDFVRAGQVILNLDNSDFLNTLNQLNAQLLQVKSNYENQKAIVERRKEMFERDLIAKEDYENALTQLRVYQEMMRSLEFQIKNVELNLKRTNLSAPFAGYIAQKMVNIGDYVTPSTPTVRLVTLNPIRLVFEIPQEYLPYVKVGLSIEAFVEGVGNVKGKIYFISPVANQDRMLTCKALVSNPEGTLKPDMYAQVNLVIGKDLAFRVPEGSVVLMGTKKVVWKIEDSVAKSVPVEIVKQGEGFVWVKGELKDGDRIALENAHLLNEGMQVKVR